MKLYSKIGYIKAVAESEFPNIRSAVKQLNKMDSTIFAGRYNWDYTKEESIIMVYFLKRPYSIIQNVNIEVPRENINHGHMFYSITMEMEME